MKSRGIRLASLLIVPLFVLDAVAQASAPSGEETPPPGAAVGAADSAADSSLAVPGAAGTKTGDQYAGAKVLEERISPHPKDPAAMICVRLIKTDDSKYPLLRVEDKLAVNATTGHRDIVEQRAMIADHIVVKLKDGDLNAIMQPLGAKIRARLPESDIYLIELPQPGIDSVPQAVERFHAAKVEFAEPDYISYIQSSMEK